MNEPLEPLPGLERYRLLRRLGSGAIGSVYVAEHVELGSKHAIKLLQAPDDERVKRLLTEGRVQAGLRHPNITSVTDVVRTQGRVALVMELVDGPDLDAFLEQNRPLDLELVDALAEGILRGMRAAHAEGVLHRDLKPANILMARADESWVPKIADFGLAKEAMDLASATQTGQIMGTPAYMAPEQARDAKNVDERADVFSLGCILYELVTGERAFQGSDVFSVLAAVGAGHYRPVAQLRDVPERMRMAIEGALQVDRALRVASVQQLLDVWKGAASFDAAPAPDATLDAFGGTVYPEEAPASAASTRRPELSTLADQRAEPLAEVETVGTLEAASSPGESAGWWRYLLAAGVGVALLAGGLAWTQASGEAEDVDGGAAPTLQTYAGQVEVALAPIVSVNMESSAGTALTMRLEALLHERGIAYRELPTAPYDAEGREQVLQATVNQPDETPIRGAIGRLGSVYTLNLERPYADGNDVRVHRMESDLDTLLDQLEPMVLTLLVGEVKGSDQGLVRDTIRRHMGQLKYCFERGLKRAPLDGRLELGFRFASGRASGVRVVSDTIGDPEVKRCMVSKVERWLFPADMEGDASWPFVFRMAESTSDELARAETILAQLLAPVEGGASAAMLASALDVPNDTAREAASWETLRGRVEGDGLPWVLAGVPGLSEEGVADLKAAWERPAIATHPERVALTALAQRLGPERVEELIGVFGDEVIEGLARCQDCQVDAMGRYWVFRTVAAAHTARCVAEPTLPVCGGAH